MTNVCHVTALLRVCPVLGTFSSKNQGSGLLWLHGLRPGLPDAKQYFWPNREAGSREGDLAWLSWSSWARTRSQLEHDPSTK